MPQDKHADDIITILNSARWAPSGDNSQPWSFEILDSNNLRIHLLINTDNTYEYNKGQPSLLSCGALIENIRLTAAHHGRSCQINPIEPSKVSDTAPQVRIINIDISLPLDTDTTQDPLFYYIQARSVDRKPYQTKTLPSYVIEDLEDCIGKDIEVKWYKSFRDKLSITRLNMISTDIRLKIPETYEIHKNILDWDNKFSTYGIPSAAIGLSSLSLASMKWAMQKWSRINFMNRYLGGTIIPKLELDLIPGLRSERHFMLSFVKEKIQYDTLDFINAGCALQRFWLTATKHNIALHPGIAPLAFGYYASNKQQFTTNEASQSKANIIYNKFTKTSDKPLDQVMFMGRIGYAKATKAAESRSVRKELIDLMHKD